MNANSETRWYQMTRTLLRANNYQVTKGTNAIRANWEGPAA